MSLVMETGLVLDGEVKDATRFPFPAPGNPTLVVLGSKLLP
jgi:hypothetical protein